MKINDSINLINTQIKLLKTPKGRPITDYALKCLQSMVSDTNNQDINVLTCLNCGLLISNLLIEKGCPNCGGLDIDDTQSIKI